MQPAPHPSDPRSIEVQELQRSSQSSVDAAAHSLSGPCQRRPWGLNWRSSPWFITLVVGVGIATDLCAYSIVVPVLPFRLEALGYPKEELSSLTSYLLISYSAGLVLFTPPIAYVTRRLNRGLRTPLLGGLVALIASQILFMLVRPYWAMCLARVIQGASSAVVWILGLVLICESVPQEIVGQQLGFALAGTSIGMVIGPPIGGVLYDRLGWNAPIIFGICIAGFDLVGRILIIESKEANIWVSTATDVDVPDKGAVVDPKAAASTPIHEKEGMSIPDSAVSQNQQVQLTTIELMMALFGSARGLTIYGLTFIYGLLYASQEPTLTLHLADVWHKDSLGVGLIYIAAIVPTFIASPAGGWFSDRFGPEFTVAPVLLLSVPWYLLQILEKSLAGFIVLLAISSFLLAAVIAPVSADLASLAQKTPGVGYVHVYSSFNIAFAVASTVGPLIGGQIYDHVNRGWLALCIFWAVLNLVSVIPSVMYMGDRPLITRLRGRRGEKSDAISSSADDERGGGDPPRVEEAAAPGTEESTKKESSSPAAICSPRMPFFPAPFSSKPHPFEGLYVYAGSMYDPIEKVVQAIPSPLPLPIIKDARQPSPSSSPPSEQATGTSTSTSVSPLTPHPEGNHGQQMQRELFVSLYSISRDEELVINVVHGKTRVESLWQVLYPGCVLRFHPSCHPVQTLTPLPSSFSPALSAHSSPIPETISAPLFPLPFPATAISISNPDALASARALLKDPRPSQRLARPRIAELKWDVVVPGVEEKAQPEREHAAFERVCEVKEAVAGRFRRAVWRERRWAEEMEAVVGEGEGDDEEIYEEE